MRSSRPPFGRLDRWWGSAAVGARRGPTVRFFIAACLLPSVLALLVAGEEVLAASPPSAELHARGNPDAPVTLIEYSDFTCGYCKKFFFETLPRIRSKYIDTGKVRFLYRDYPRASQGPAVEAAVAARCAGDQGRYWSMHDRLFGGRLERAEFERHAKSLSLNLSTFMDCMRQARHRDEIFRDKGEGVDIGFRGTPGFVLMRTDGTGQAPAIAIPGAFPFEVFEEQIDWLLKVVARK